MFHINWVEFMYYSLRNPTFSELRFFQVCFDTLIYFVHSVPLSFSIVVIPGPYTRAEVAAMPPD